MIDKRRELNDAEQGQLADMIRNAGYMGVIETLISFAQADAHGQNEDVTLSRSDMLRCSQLADDLIAIEV